MPEVLGNPPSPRTALFWNGTAWQWALVDAAGHLQLDVLTIAAGVDVATATNQALILAQLQLIEDIRDALQSVGTDRLIVRGEDQLYSFKGVLGLRRQAIISGADGIIDSIPVPAGEIWRVTSISGLDLTSPTTEHIAILIHDGLDIQLGGEVRAFPTSHSSRCLCDIWADEDDYLRVVFMGGLVGDTVFIYVAGHKMTLET